ncbi:MAG: quinone-dependent dihydroorotate dehydrogenase [Pseudomonadota bacterium]
MLFELARPALFALSPERAHGLTITALKAGLIAPQKVPDPAILKTQLAGIDLPNPIGLAAGFDKNAEVPWAMSRLGFGLVEVGTITPRPQSGNPKPRVFRLPQDGAVINRLGFNNAGLRDALRRVRKVPRDIVLGVNVGANKTSENRVEDYAAGISALANHARYITINISSPNTPGLRDLQASSELSYLIERSVAARGDAHVPMFIKLAPDMGIDALKSTLDAAQKAGADGFILTNTTLERPAALRSSAHIEAGGLSGAPLMAPSTQLLAQAARHVGTAVPLIGVGGVSSGADAFAKIAAGAHTVQLYSALIYHGPGLIQAIKRDLANILETNGFKTVSDAVGSAL